MKFFKMLGLDYSPWTDGLVKKLSRAEYRHEYVTEGVKTWVARQVRVLREQRGWSQDDLGVLTEKPQSAISRLEDPDYGKLTLQTLFDLAKAYDVGLVVKFVDYPTFIRETKSVDTQDMTVSSFDVEQFQSSRRYGVINLGSSSKTFKVERRVSDDIRVPLRTVSSTAHNLVSGVAIQ